MSHLVISQLITFTLQQYDIFTGNHIRERLRTWLPPPNPSTNHNIACDAQHEGTGQWFFRGTIFNQLKSSDPLLWVHGKRVFLFSFSMSSMFDHIQPHSGLGKEYNLVRSSLSLSTSRDLLVV